ncbi:MAG: photosynthetic complex assembly protein PuhC [Gemmatimonadaceae bacterium]|nr:photosynthetic complex assembly protein PuhC [Acetobacteraceae bacterium]
MKPAAILSRLPTIIVVGSVGLAFVLAIGGRLTNDGVVAQTGSVVSTRELRFADGPEGSVVVTDAKDGAVVEVFTGENGFVRGTLRGLARARRAEGVGSEPAFRLTSWSDGRLTLDDPQTTQHIELQAFGPDNTIIFTKLLTANGAAK